MSVKQVLALVVLILCVTLSAVRVASDAHHVRLMNQQIDTLQEVRLALQVQRGQLLIERSALITPARIEHRAVEELKMRVPEVAEIQVIRP